MNDPQELESKIKNAKRELENKKDQPAFMGNARSPTKIMVDIISGVAVGAIFGYFIDSGLGTMPLFMFLLVVFGAVCGVYLVHKDMRRHENIKNNKDKNA